MSDQYGLTEYGRAVHIVKSVGKIRTRALCGHELLTTKPAVEAGDRLCSICVRLRHVARRRDFPER